MTNEKTYTLRKVQLKALRRVARLSKQKDYVDRSELTDYDMPYINELMQLKLIDSPKPNQYSLSVSGMDLLDSGSTPITRWVPVFITILRDGEVGK